MVRERDRPKALRCAIYTRKSSEEGLEQEFNSLHAQREACEAYIRSQVHEGWKLVPTAYDDGGYSGGTMERPGLKLLLADVHGRRVDVVVVYKVDRLTRALNDFARIVEVFDASGVSFVSVTQQFNTTTSMGRLTLNVLLSFAQFEREVTGERIGLVTLASDVAFSLLLPIPTFLASHVLWQAGAGLIFLALVLLWMYWGFVRPPVFGRLNARYFAAALYRIILKGDPTEMATIAHELGRSAKNIIAIAGSNKPHRHKVLRARPKNAANGDERPHNATAHAHAVLLLIGAKRFCREVVAKAPGTAIALFQEMAEQAAYNIPIRQFSTNLAGAAVENKQSLLYHEDSGFVSGALGYWKPFSIAVFGNWELVEALGRDNGAPLDIDYDYRRGWDGEQLEAYTRAVLVTFKNYLDSGSWHYHSYVFERAFETIENALGDTYKLDGQPSEAWTSESYEKLRVAVDFLRNAIDLIGKVDPLPPPNRLRVTRNGPFVFRDMYDQLAELGFEVIKQASYVRQSEDLSWSVQHNAVWSRLFGLTSNSKAWRIIQFKIRRHLYEEIVMKWGLNYLSSRLLGMCLNVMGIKSISPKNRSDRDEYPLRKALLAWCRRGLMREWEQHPDVVESGLPANLKLDSKLRRLVRTFPKFLDRKPKVVYFQLN